MELIHPFWAYVLIFLFSLAVGSFLNVLIHRLPIMLKNEWEQECRSLMNMPAKEKKTSFNLFWPNSHCPKCQAPIRIRDNVPILSYLSLRGRCYKCNTKISLRYPFIELITALLTLYAAWHFSLTPLFLFTCGFLWLTIAITAIDLDEQLIPDSLSYSLLWLGLIASSFGLFTDLQTAVYSAIGGWFFLWLFIRLFYLATGKIGMGNGDFKLFAAFGAWFGWTKLPLILLLSSFIGAIIGIIYLRLSRLPGQTPIPFGPFLCLAGLVTLFWGNDIIKAYLSLYP